jgi:DNA polymerase I-like protein with 3'-5' exonuclease and polymerase domains
MFDKKPSPLVTADFAQIEARMMADMASVLGVPEKMVRHGLNHQTGTITGRITRTEPPFKEMPRTKD